jgi:uncharacterized OB-fold protein
MPKPIPVPTAVSAPFWDALRRHEFVLQQCSNCRAFNHPPKITCPKCHSLDLKWAPVATTGTVYSFTIVHRAPTPAFKNDVPYAVGLVDIDGTGVRLLSSLEVPPEEIRVGLPVQLSFDDVAEDFTLFRFRKAGG